MENTHRHLVPFYSLRPCFPGSQQVASWVQPRPNTQFAVVINVIAQAVAEKVEHDVLEHLEHAAPRVQPVLLSVRDAAAYLGRSEQSIQHLIFSHELPVVRVGRRVHLDRRDLDLWIEKNKY